MTGATHTMVDFVDVPLDPPKPGAPPVLQAKLDVRAGARFMQAFTMVTQNEILKGTPLERAKVTLRITFEADPKAAMTKRSFLIAPPGVGIPVVSGDERGRMIATFMHPQIGVPFALFEVSGRSA